MNLSSPAELQRGAGPDAGEVDDAVMADVAIADSKAADTIPPDTTPVDAARPDSSLLTLGSSCTGSSACGSGICANGVCCSSACVGGCSACNLPGTMGTCANKPPTALIGYWKLDEQSGFTAADSSCNGNNGTLMEYATPDWRASGKVGRALGFDGTSNWVKVPASASLDTVATTNALTILAWVYRTASGIKWANVIDRQYADSGKEHYTLSFDDRTDTNLVFLLSTQSATPGSCRTATPPPLGQWMHIAGTFDGATGRLYFNGTEACSFPHSVAQIAETKPLIIGGNANDATDDAQELLNGVIDEAAIYSRALTAAEVKAVATGESPPLQ